MTENCFIFDCNKCVGCMACVVGCSIANGTPKTINWRSVNGFNTMRHPGLPVFHYSLACNHCEEAPCMKNCPALAYSRDESTGAIVHHAESCIGCQYCTWACPYDAPKYNASTQTVEKCNFCLDRIATGGVPACVEACPLGALSYGLTEPNGDTVLVPGFVQQSLGPKIELIPLRKTRQQPEIITDQPTTTLVDDTLLIPQKSKITARKDWPLVVFTLLVPASTAWFAAHITHDATLIQSVFIAMISVSGLISFLHLGKKKRAWRAVANIRQSWLSREIAAFSAFAALSVSYFLFPAQLLGWLATGTAMIAAIAIDFVYHRVRPKGALLLHSSSALLTTILLWAITTNNFFTALALMVVKGTLYGLQNKNRNGEQEGSRKTVQLWRLAALSVPAILMLLWPEKSMIIALLALAGEITDRIDFYNRVKITTPAEVLNEHYVNLLNRQKR